MNIIVAARPSVPFLPRKIFGCAGVVETPLTTSIESATVVAGIYSDIDN